MENQNVAVPAAGTGVNEQEYVRAESATSTISSSAEAFAQGIRELTEKRNDKDEGPASQGSVVKLSLSQRVITNILMYAYVVLASGVFLVEFVMKVKAAFEVDIQGVSLDLPSVLMLVVGIILLIISSAWQEWNFHSRKIMLLIILTSLTGLCLMSFYYTFIACPIVPLLLIPEPNRWVTEEKWMFLIRAVTIIPTIIATLFSVLALCRTVFDRFALKGIYDFRIANHIDLRKDKKYKYDATVVRRLSNGRSYTIRENDRFLHSLINGSTGTAKTSSVITPMVNGDLNTRVQNEDLQKQMVAKMLNEGKLTMKYPVTDDDFDINAFEAVDSSAEKKLKEIMKKYPKCGITIIAPDDSLTDSVFKLCKAKGIKCNLVDPITKSDGSPKDGFTGFNPLYISPDIPTWQRKKEIVKRATLFADVMEAINDLKGKGDPYFTSLNRQITVAFSICLCVTFPVIEHRQPNPGDIQSMVNQFSRIKPYYEELKRINDADTDKTFGFVVDLIGNDVLGKGLAAEKMNDQARGLRMTMNEFLTNPLIRRLLCSTDEKMTVDLDKMLGEGQITVVNYALELGKTDSTGFGLFFLLSMIDAVLRRPGAEGSVKLPHFLIIDELPVILHPQIEQAVSLFRKYKVGIVGCIQSLDQMGKNETTKFLKGVLMGGCSHHFLFGRCGVNEMKEYSTLAGKEWVVTEQESVSETSITSEDPSLSYSTRTQLTQQDKLDPGSIRNLQFQEITMFSVVNSSIIPPFFAKVDFLKDSQKKKIERPKYDWKSYYVRYGSGDTGYTDDEVRMFEDNMAYDDDDDYNPFVKNNASYTTNVEDVAADAVPSAGGEGYDGEEI